MLIPDPYKTIPIIIVTVTGDAANLFKYLSSTKIPLKFMLLLVNNKLLFL